LCVVFSDHDSLIRVCYLVGIQARLSKMRPEGTCYSGRASKSKVLFCISNAFKALIYDPELGEAEQQRLFANVREIDLRLPVSSAGIHLHYRTETKLRVLYLHARDE
jgi:hypothetical protein